MIFELAAANGQGKGVGICHLHAKSFGNTNNILTLVNTTKMNV